jgi:hypothetical protein
MLSYLEAEVSPRVQLVQRDSADLSKSELSSCSCLLISASLSFEHGEIGTIRFEVPDGVYEAEIHLGI